MRTLDIVKAYIAGSNKEQIEELSKAIIDRQTVLINTRNLKLQEMRQQKILS